MPPPVAAAQQNTAVINTVTTMVCVRVLTDMRKPVRNERVLLLLADGSTRQEITDERGDADFTGLTAPPFSAAFIVLPDILEQWTERPELPFKQTMRMPWGDQEVDLPIDPATETLRRLHKDEIDKRQNAPRRREADYRYRDFMKHAALVCPESALTRVIGPTPDDPCRETIVIDRLTEAEKFACFREFIESNRAFWSPGPYSYDDARHRWNLRRGCVCNQFANLFMGYWCNHNGAFNAGASGTDFLSQMQNDSDRDRNDAIYSFRGFADVCDDPQGNNGFVVGLSTWVRKFYAGKLAEYPLPANRRLPYLYEVRVLEHALLRFGPGPAQYHVFWVNKRRDDDQRTRSDELHLLIEHFARHSRFGHDGVLPRKSFVGKTLEAKEREYFSEYEYELNQPNDPDHRTEVLHPVFVRPPAANLKIGHLTDLHLDTRLDVLEQNMQKFGAGIHNWNEACREVYAKAKPACDLLLMTGDLIDYGRAYSGRGPMNDYKSYWRDRNWFVFYHFLASGANYSVPVYTTLGNHDWRFNPYPIQTPNGAPQPHELGAKKESIVRAHGPGATARTYSTDPGMAIEGIVRLLFDRDGSFEVGRTPLVTTTASIAWYLLLINPFLDYACRIPGGYNLLLLDWAEQEVVDQDLILGGQKQSRGLFPDNYGGPRAKSSLTSAQKELVVHVAGQSGAKILGIHQPPIGPHEHCPDDELARGRVRYTLNDLRAAVDTLGVVGNRVTAARALGHHPPLFQGTDDERVDSLHRLSGVNFDHPLLAAIADGVSHPGGEYPVLAMRTVDFEPLGRDADCGSLIREREWLISTLRKARFSVVLAGHIHRRNVLIVDALGNDLPREWRGKWVVRSVPSGRPPQPYATYFVNSTSTGPLGHVYVSRGQYMSAESAYTFVNVAASGAVSAIEFRPDQNRKPGEVRAQARWTKPTAAPAIRGGPAPAPKTAPAPRTTSPVPAGAGK